MLFDEILILVMLKIVKYLTIILFFCQQSFYFDWKFLIQSTLYL